MHRSELNVLRLGAIVAIKRDTVLFFPKTGGGEELLLFVSNELSSRNFARENTFFATRRTRGESKIVVGEMFLVRVSEGLRRARWLVDVRNSCHALNNRHIRSSTFVRAPFTSRALWVTTRP